MSLLSEVLEPGTLGTPCQLVTNFSRVEVDESREFFMYHIKINEKMKVKGEDYVHVLSDGVANNDFSDQRCKRAVISIFNRMLAVAPNYFQQALYQIYDRQSIVFTLHEIEGARTQELVLTLDPKGIPDLDERVICVEVVIKAACNDLGQHVKVVASVLKDAARFGSDKSILEVMNLAVSQQPFFDIEHFRSYRNGSHYLIQQPGQREGFSANDFPELKEGKTVAVGISEAFRVLGNGIPYVVTDVKKSAFHAEIPLWNKIVDMFPNERFDPRKATVEQRSFIERQLKGLYVTTSYITKGGVKSNVKIRGLGSDCLSTYVDIDGEQISLRDYYKKQYGIELLHPECFTVVGIKNCLFPIELLVVGAGQRVSVPQQTPAMVATLIKACAMKPVDRLRQTTQMKNMIGLNSASERLREYGLTVSNEFEKVEGRTLPTPQVVYGQDAAVQVKDNCKWMSGNKYVAPSKISAWAVVALVAGNDGRFGETMNEFMKRYRSRCELRGMNVPAPSDFWMFTNPTTKVVQEVFEQAVQKNYDFLFFLSSDRVILHDHIKYYELRYQILTQEVRMTTVRNVVEKSQNMTLDNVSAKTNLKCGGLNYSLRLTGGAKDTWIHSPERLIIGFDVMNPAQLSTFEMLSNDDPWVLGWSANCSAHPLSYVGDYLYVKARNPQSVHAQLKMVMEEILKRFYESRQNTVPNHIYAYFNGVSEGQWELIGTSYLEAIKSGIASMYGQMEHPKLTFLVCSKSHSERFYKQTITGTNSAQQNLPPGTVIDKKITSSIVSEFYLNAHSAFQGTAKTPKYTVLVDENEKKMPMNAHECVAHALCYLHGIVSMTVSVPAPLIVADRCAKRGHAVYKAARDILGQAAPVTDEQANSELTNHANAGRAVGGRTLVNKRFNA